MFISADMILTRVISKEYDFIFFLSFILRTLWITIEFPTFTFFSDVVFDADNVWKSIDVAYSLFSRKDYDRNVWVS